LRPCSYLAAFLIAALISGCGSVAHQASTGPVSSPPLADRCPLPDFQELPRNHARCLFFSGTQSFRDRNYASASASWQAIVDLGELPNELERYRTDAYNNLGFLYFTGQGVPKDRDRAVDFWKYANKLGHAESAYHLCHVYAEPAAPDYDPKAALGYCRESLRRYTQSTTRGDGGESGRERIVAQLNGFIDRLEAR